MVTNTNATPPSKNQMFTRRYIVIIAFMCLMATIFATRLLNMQVANTQYYKQQNNYSRTVLANVTAVRGDIYDRNGILLVTNENYYKLEINGGINPVKTYKRTNEIIGSVIGLCKLYNTPMEPDGLPVLAYEGAEGRGWTYSMELSTNTTVKNRLSKYLEKYKLPPETTADELMRHIVNTYGLQDIPSEYLRQMAGMWYEFDRIGFFSGAVYTLASDIDIKLISAVKELSRDLPGVQVVQATRRIYMHPDVGAHIIGRIGPIFAEEYEAYEALGYRMDAIVGKDGVEKAFEEYLHGTDGLIATTYDIDGYILEQKYRKEPVAGRDVYLTIDIKLQQKAQDYLKSTIERINREHKTDEELTGEDADAGSIVALNPNNGEILALATYPYYSLATFNDDFSSLNTDKLKPLLNRAVNGRYTPGSIFKISTALACLMDGKIRTDEYITDKGVFTKFEDYQPKCWVWNPYSRRTHGTINVSQALRDSCNYFFFTVGDRLGITRLNYYSQMLGLGSKTGIEISENTGILAGPEERKLRNEAWYGGDTIQAAIGQSDNAFTPLQMATMLGTVVNGGTRYASHLLQKVENFDDKTISYYKKTEIYSSLEIPQEYLEAIKQGMGQVVEDGSVKALFSGLPYTAGAKTGTAQTNRKKSDLATFVSFAPYNNPEIVVSVVIEQGYKGASAGYAARDLLNWYFNVGDIQNKPEPPPEEEPVDTAQQPTSGVTDTEPAE